MMVAIDKFFQNKSWPRSLLATAGSERLFRGFVDIRIEMYRLQAAGAA
jgi:hypothetical protein